MKLPKIHPALLILAALLSLVLVCTGLYFIGYLDFFIIFILIPAGVIGSLCCFLYSLISALKAKKEGAPLSNGKKLALILSSVILGTVIVSVTALVIVFAMAIAFM